MTPLCRLGTAALLGALAGLVVSEGYGDPFLRCVLTALCFGALFGAAVVVDSAIDAAHRRAQRRAQSAWASRRGGVA